MSRIYKILSAEAWRAADAVGRFEGSGIDLTDGFIHFSTAAQTSETARLHFRDQEGLVALEVEADDLGVAHLYDPLPTHCVRAVHPLPLAWDGVPTPATALR